MYIYPRKASQVLVNTYIYIYYNIYLPPCKTILLRVLNIVHDSRLDSSFILVSLCVLSRLHTRSFPPARYTHAHPYRTHYRSPCSTRLSLTPSLILSLARSVYIFLTVSLYIIAPAPHIIITLYYIYICVTLSHFADFLIPHGSTCLCVGIYTCTHIYIWICTTLQIRRLIHTHSRARSRRLGNFNP